jgi:hypothetical protein
LRLPRLRQKPWSLDAVVQAVVQAVFQAVVQGLEISIYICTIRCCAYIYYSGALLA